MQRTASIQRAPPRQAFAPAPASASIDHCEQSPQTKFARLNSHEVVASMEEEEEDDESHMQRMRLPHAGARAGALAVDSTSLAVAFAFLPSADINAAMRVCRRWKLDTSGFSLLTKLLSTILRPVDTPRDDWYKKGHGPGSSSSPAPLPSPSLPEEYFLRTKPGALFDGPCGVRTPWHRDDVSAPSLRIIIRLHGSTSDEELFEEGPPEFFHQQAHRVLNVRSNSVPSESLLLRIKQRLEVIQDSAFAAQEATCTDPPWSAPDASSGIGISMVDAMPLIVLTILDGDVPIGTDSAAMALPIIALTKGLLPPTRATKLQQNDWNKIWYTLRQRRNPNRLTSEPLIPLLFGSLILRSRRGAWLSAFLASHLVQPEAREWSTPDSSVLPSHLSVWVEEAVCHGGALSLMRQLFLRAPQGCTSERAMGMLEGVLQPLLSADGKSPAKLPFSLICFDGFDSESGLEIDAIYRTLLKFSRILNTVSELYLIGITGSLRYSIIFSRDSDTMLVPRGVSTLALVAHPVHGAYPDDAELQLSSSLVADLYLVGLTLDSFTLLSGLKLRRCRVRECNVGDDDGSLVVLEDFGPMLEQTKVEHAERTGMETASMFVHEMQMRFLHTLQSLYVALRQSAFWTLSLVLICLVVDVVCTGQLALLPEIFTSLQYPFLLWSQFQNKILHYVPGWLFRGLAVWLRASVWATLTTGPAPFIWCFGQFLYESPVLESFLQREYTREGVRFLGSNDPALNHYLWPCVVLGGLWSGVLTFTGNHGIVMTLAVPTVAFLLYGFALRIFQRRVERWQTRLVFIARFIILSTASLAGFFCTLGLMYHMGLTILEAFRLEVYIDTDQVVQTVTTTPGSDFLAAFQTHLAEQATSCPVELGFTQRSPFRLDAPFLWAPQYVFEHLSRSIRK